MATATPRKVRTAKAIFLALLVHLAVLALLFVSVKWHQARQPAALKKEEIVRATVVNDAQVRAEMERLRQEQQRRQEDELASAKRAEDAKRAAQEAEARRAQEEQRLEQLKQTEQARQLELKRTEAARAEAKRRQDSERQAQQKRAQEAERKRAAAAEQQRQQAEAERKRVQDQKRKDAELALREQLQQEEKQREDARAARALAEAERFKELIRQKVERSWTRPASAQQGLSCVVRVRLVPGGEVLDAHVVRSSGNAAFDRSVENAVFKSSPLPAPTDKYTFEYFRELEFTFNPRS